MQIYGKESSGKTAVAMTAIREAQRNGKMGAIIDAEHAVSEELLVVSLMGKSFFQCELWDILSLYYE